MIFPPDNLECVVINEGRRMRIKLDPLPDGKKIFEANAEVAAAIPTEPSSEKGKLPWQ